MKKLFPLIALIILFTLGCGKSEEKKKEEPKKVSSEEVTSKGATPSANKIVARVNGRPIYEEDLRGRSLEYAITDEILYEEGLKRGLDKKLEPQVERYKRGLIVNAIKTEIISRLPKKEEVSDKEIEDYYNENQSKYTQLRVKEIVTGDKNLAEEIHKRALSGEDLEKIASDYSKSGKNVVVTDLGFDRRFNTIFGGKDIGSVSDVIQEGNEFKTLKLVDMRKVPLYRASLSIKYILLAKGKVDAVREYAEKVKKEDNIKVEVVGGEGK